jgi:hypothetical protein
MQTICIWLGFLLQPLIALKFLGYRRKPFSAPIIFSSLPEWQSQE